MLGNIQLGTIWLSLHSNPEGITYHGCIQNAPGNLQYVFRDLLDGALHEKGADIRAKLYDKHD